MGDKFQRNFEIIRLYDEKQTPAEVTKVGVLPFISARHPADWKILAMKPRAEAKHLGEPMFQLAKGTRRINVNDRWCDMREDDLRYADASFHEPIVDTALREGNEEVGLKTANISRMFDMGGYTFTSATKGLKKPLHMFAAEIIDEKDFGAFESTTAEARWLIPEEFGKLGRKDHIAILDDMLTRLIAYFARGN